MIIKKYSCKRFAGISNKSIEFNEGINILIGPNESGKSTMVEGIHSVLFKSTRFDGRSTEDKYFLSKFMPVSTGDSIDGTLIVSNDEGDFILSREWGAKPSSLLVMPNSDVIKNEDRINDALKKVLIFGEGTYSSILFSKQIHIREALERIMGNKEAVGEISSLLRKAIMELDGVSINDLKMRIDEEIDILLKKWDIDRNYPENNRGISNPYKTGIGEVVNHFYKKESIRQSLEDTDKKEKNFEQICNQLKNLEERLTEFKNKKESMEKLENDVIKDLLWSLK